MMMNKEPMRLTWRAFSVSVLLFRAEPSFLFIYVFFIKLLFGEDHLTEA